MSYSIVVVTWECAAALANLVTSMDQHLAPSPELIVVDNSSSDQPERVLEHWDGPSQFVRLSSNQGFGAANNLGVSAASNEAVVLLNPDTELIDGSLPRLASEAVRRQALVGPRILEADGGDQPSASGPPSGIWPWLSVLIPGTASPGWVLEQTEPWRLGRETPVHWLTGACVAGPRSALLGLGPFDPAIHLYGEDMDLGLRARARGIPSIFAPQTCRLIHHGKASTSVRFDDFGRAAAAANRRVVLRRAVGARAEVLAWWAERARLRVRIVFKTLLRTDVSWERIVSLAARKAARPRKLPPFD